jgi:hypothetical protein
MRRGKDFQRHGGVVTALSRTFASRFDDTMGLSTEAKMKLLLTGILMALSAAFAQAQEPKQTAIDVVQAELSICTVYYSFVRGCAIEKSDINSATVATANADKLRKYAFQAGQTIRMDNDSMIKRQKIAIEQQQKLLEGNCDNMPKLEEAYGNRCKQLSDDPQAILDQYLKR